jgi:thiol-disulfide isomerase/thioredoxin
MWLSLIVGAALAQTPPPSPTPPPPPVASGERVPEMIPVEALDLVGKPAPGFEAPLLRGGSFKLQEQKGKVVILSFWASWCGPCRQELPALSNLQKQRPDLAIFAVNVDRNKADAERFLSQVQFELPIVWDNQAMALGQYEVLSMPTMFLLDRNQKVVWRKTGFSQENGLKELEAKLQEVK